MGFISWLAGTDNPHQKRLRRDDNGGFFIDSTPDKMDDVIEKYLKKVENEEKEKDFHYQQMLTLFREIGIGSIRQTFLRYFRRELNNTSLTMESSVFPKPDSKNLVDMNNMSVVLCMRDNWSAIQKSYPCVKDFKYVVGDIDYMYIFSYPYVDMKTRELHGVETVQDFVDFAMEVVTKACIPCLTKKSMGCSSMGKKMEESLELCAKTKCTKTREKLLRFFIHHIKKNGGTDDRKPSSAVNMVPMDYAPVMPVMPPMPPVMDVATPSVNSLFHRPPNEYTSVIEGVQLDMKRRHGDDVQVFVDDSTDIKSEVYQISKDHFKRLEAAGEEITDTSVLMGMTPVINSKERSYNVQVFDGKVDLLGVYDKFGKVIQTPGELEEDRAEIQHVMDEVKSGNIEILGEIVKSVHDSEVPVTFEIVGGTDDNGNWHTKYIVYVINEEMRVSHMDKIKLVYGRLVDGEANVFMEDRANMVGDLENVLQTNGENLSGTSLEGKNFMQNFRKNVFNLDGEPDDGYDPVVFADAAVNTMFGTGEKFLDDDHRVALYIVSDKSAQEHREEFRQLLSSLGDRVDMKHDLESISYSNNLERAFRVSDRAHELQRKYEQRVIDDPSTENTSALAKQKSAVEKLDAEFNASLQRYIAGSAGDALDEAGLKLVPGYGEIMRLRNIAYADNGKIREGLNEKDQADAEKFTKALQLARAFRKKRQGNMTPFQRIMREKNPEGGWVFPLGAVGIIKAYRDASEIIEDTPEADLLDDAMAAILTKGLIEDLEGISMSDLLEFSSDVRVAYDLLIPRELSNGFMIPPEQQAVKQGGTFLAIWAAISISALVASYNMKTKGEKRMVSVMKHSLITIVGSVFFFHGVGANLVAFLGFNTLKMGFVWGTKGMLGLLRLARVIPPAKIEDVPDVKPGVQPPPLVTPTEIKIQIANLPRKSRGMRQLNGLISGGIGQTRSGTRVKST
ncbi:unnamed protein product [Pylaiella littoralis]